MIALKNVKEGAFSSNFWNINFSSEFIVRYRNFTVLGKPWFRDLNFAWSSRE
jgi:hypothetical protein